MTRLRSSTKRRKSIINSPTINGKKTPTPTVQSPAADNVHDPSPAAVTVGCNVDLLTEILLRSPAKSLFRFKCVSKSWLSLISDSQFAHDHSRRNPRSNPVSGLYFYSGSRLKSVSFHGKQSLPSLPFVDVPGHPENETKIADSCNGLFLCANIYRRDGKNFVAQYFLCNVSTQKHRVLPQPYGNLNESPDYCAFLAFDPSKSPHYKVVLVRNVDYPPSKIFVFSSRTMCWEKVFAQNSPYYAPGVYWNGAIHWANSEDCLRFDVESEEMIETPNPPLPKIEAGRMMIRYLGGCGGKLFLIQSSSRKALGFRMLELRGNWKGSYHVNLRPIISAFPEIEKTFEFDVLSLLCVGDGEKKEDFALVLAIPGRIIVYNLHWKTCDVLCGLLEGEHVDGHWKGYGYGNDYAYPFVASLSLV